MQVAEKVQKIDISHAKAIVLCYIITFIGIFHLKYKNLLWHFYIGLPYVYLQT